ncbi:NAD-dependent epimerase/dehydratase family protein [Thermosynechococcaceae cyanobacterium BACA0444]|uniref:NAD-dependent epimerase/dehydratase family protein n=1 Tax=Pseudocalidococcus azoricus BACA0444 TaxID=2918990 RepID=A0AAE4FUS4_9CYAN|nr:hopanoid-associated sugar epimerase [Pseudocalidococcus azoricus]MDS3861692.1 NAD-dependent epimerase/dehydratase family protein [Pseudocalidococcus azoricus BACA0444]
MGQTAFVTGGSGFVGSNLIRLLQEQGWQVKALVRNPEQAVTLEGLDIELIPGDLTQPNLSQGMTGCQALFHVAAHYSLWRRDEKQLYQSNVFGTRNILKAAQAAGVERVVYTSSVAAIGVDPSGRPGTEAYQSPPEKLISAYKQSKYWAEQEAHQAIKKGQDIVIVNPTTPIGPWDVKPTPTGDLIVRFLRNQMPAYVDTGLNLIHVRDVAWGHLLAYEKGKTGERYILGHQNLSLKEILEKLAAITGKPAPKVTIPVIVPLIVAWIDELVLGQLGKTPSVPVDGVLMSKQKMYYDASKAINELNLPQTPVDQALKEAVDWFLDHGYID